MTSTSHEGICTFFVSLWCFGLRKVSDRSCCGNQNTCFIKNKFFWKVMPIKKNIYYRGGQRNNYLLTHFCGIT